MSIAGFRSQNHPQQVSKRGADPLTDDRGTLPELFDPLNERFAFTLDVAASAANAKCAHYYTADDDALIQLWYGRVWCNPPYSDLHTWVSRAWETWTRMPGAATSPDLIVMLVPANRTEQKWWQELVEPYRDKPDGVLRVEFLAGRPRFSRPSAVIGPKGDRPPFGCCLLIWGPR